MSHENSLQIEQSELASEYGRHVEAKSKKSPMRFVFKALAVPVIALLVIVTGAAFAIANFSPATYSQAKDIIFANIDIEKLTGLPDSTVRQQLDNWLILNSEQQQMGTIVQEEPAQKEAVQSDQLESPLNKAVE